MFLFLPTLSDEGKLVGSRREAADTHENGSSVGEGLTFVHMLCRGGLGVERGETEEREERQSSPLGHHFFTNKSLQASGTPEKIFKKEILTIPGRLLEMHSGGRKVQSPKMCRNIGSQVLLKLAG